MATFDFAPMFRSTIGFDHLPDLLSHALQREASAYPPYNIEKLGPDSYQIVMAVAGFARDEIEILQAEDRITVRGTKKDDGEKSYLLRGLASMPFSREFDIADYVKVTDGSLSKRLPDHFAEARATGGAETADDPV